LIAENECLASVAALVFYGINGLDLHALQDLAYKLIVGVADGRLT
jgi:prophage maintenance system killer protein